MAITYNTFRAGLLTHIYLSDGGVFGANQVAATAFDYFPDDAAVNDALYFGGPNQLDVTHQNAYRNTAVRGLRVYVGTAFAANSVTFVWEYYNGSAWIALPNVTNGDALTLSGEQTISWDPLTCREWGWNAVNGVTSRWVRCRISAVNTPTEGGAQSTQTVLAGDNTITVTGTGNTYDTIKTAAVAGSYSDVFYEPYENFFVCKATLIIGDGTTATVLTANAMAHLMAFWFVGLRVATLNIGTLYGSNLVGSQGGSIIYNHPGYDAQGFLTNGACTLNLYAARFYNQGAMASTQFSSGSTVNAVDADFSDGTGSDLGGYLELSQTSGTFLRCKLLGRGGSVTLRPGSTYEDCVFEDIQLRDNITLRSLSCDRIALAQWFGGNYVMHLINSAFNTVTGGSHASCPPNVLSEEYTQDIAIQDANGTPLSGVAVYIWDAGSANVTDETTDGVGEIPQQALVKKTYTANYQANTVTEADKTPHQLKLMSYAHRFFQLTKTVSQAADDVFVLETDPFITETTEATALAYTGISVNHVAQLVTISAAHSIQELYDHLKALNKSSAAQALYDQILTTVDGSNFQCAYDLTVDGVTLSGSGTLDLGSKTFSAINGGGTTLTVSDVNGTLVSVTLTNVVIGSRYRIETTAGVEIAAGEAASSTVAVNYQHTVDVLVNVIVRKGSGSPKYLPWSTQGTITSSGLSIRAAQVADSIA